MERSEIRGIISSAERPVPDCAALHPGYGSPPSDLRIHLQQIPIGIPEEQRAMAEGLVRRRFKQIDAVPHQLVGAAIDVINARP